MSTSKNIFQSGHLKNSNTQLVRQNLGVEIFSFQFWNVEKVSSLQNHHFSLFKQLNKVHFDLIFDFLSKQIFTDAKKKLGIMNGRV